MGVSSSESHDLTAFHELLTASFGVLSQNTGFYPSLDRIVETTLGPLNLGPGGGSYNEPISRLQCARHLSKQVTMDHAHYKAKMDQILSKVVDPELVEEGMKPELRLALIKAMKQDEKEVRDGKIRSKGKQIEGCKDCRVL